MKARHFQTKAESLLIAAETAQRHIQEWREAEAAWEIAQQNRIEYPDLSPIEEDPPQVEADVVQSRFYHSLEGQALLAERLQDGPRMLQERQHLTPEQRTEAQWEASRRAIEEWNAAETAWEATHPLPQIEEVENTEPQSRLQPPPKGPKSSKHPQTPELNNPPPTRIFPDPPPRQISTDREARIQLRLTLAQQTAAILRQPIPTTLEDLFCEQQQHLDHAVLHDIVLEADNAFLLVTQRMKEELIRGVGGEGVPSARRLMDFVLSYDCERNAAEGVRERGIARSMREVVMGKYVVERFEDSVEAMQYLETKERGVQGVFEGYWRDMMEFAGIIGEDIGGDVEGGVLLEMFFEVRGEWLVKRKEFEGEFVRGWGVKKREWEEGMKEFGVRETQEGEEAAKEAGKQPVQEEIKKEEKVEVVRGVPVIPYVDSDGEL